MSFGNEREFIDYLQRKEVRAMKCPLYKAAGMVNKRDWEGFDASCDKEECAWWDRQAEMCTWLCQGRSLALILVKLIEIEAKMPHELQFRKV